MQGRDGIQAWQILPLTVNYLLTRLRCVPIRPQGSAPTTDSRIFAPPSVRLYVSGVRMPIRSDDRDGKENSFAKHHGSQSHDLFGNS